VLDIHLPDGSILEILPNIQRLYPDIKLSIFSMQPVDIYRHALRHYGIRYYISKASMEDEMLDLFGKFLNNEPSPVDDFDVPETPFYRLSAREFEVLHYLLKGNTSVEIAAILNLSRQTVATHRSRILEKTKTETLQQLTELASLYNLN
jgi:two-component system response regulator FimZ (fimbrial Z protein)